MPRVLSQYTTQIKPPNHISIYGWVDLNKLDEFIHFYFSPSNKSGYNRADCLEYTGEIQTEHSIGILRDSTFFIKEYNPLDDSFILSNYKHSKFIITCKVPYTDLIDCLHSSNCLNKQFTVHLNDSIIP